VDAVKAVKLKIRELAKETCLDTDVRDFCCFNYIASLPFCATLVKVVSAFPL